MSMCDCKTLSVIDCLKLAAEYAFSKRVIKNVELFIDEYNIDPIKITAKLEADFTLPVWWEYDRVSVGGVLTQYSEFNGDKQLSRAWSTIKCCALLNPKSMRFK